MNYYNVIDQLSDLESLEEDYSKWSSLSYGQRRMSDEDCLRLHGMTNQQLYEQTKAKLVNYNIGDGPIKESSYQLDEDYQQKVDLTKQVGYSPNINLLIPYSYKSEQELIDAFETYQYLGYKSRLMSDEYSRQIWGFTVPDIFTFEKERLSNDKAELESPVDEMSIIEEKYEKSESKRITSVIESMIAKDDKIGLLQNRLQQYYEGVPDSIKEVYEKMDDLILDTVNQKFDREYWNDRLPAYTPYFTMDEMFDNQVVGNLDYNEWKDKLIEAVQHNDYDSMYQLGWNPGVAFTEKNVEYARQRQLNWLEHNIPKIVDIQGISEKFDNVLTETSDEAHQIYKENDLYPLFIVLSYTGSLVGKGINFVKKSQWSHAGISTDVELKQINSYNFRGKEYNGFTEDNLGRYLKENGDSTIEVICIFVDHKTFIKVKGAIRDIKNKVKDTRYNFGNIVNMMFNKAKKFDYPENLALVCSQFVDLTLRVANIELVNKPNNLVLPQDFANIATKNPKAYKVYEGLARRYDYKKVERDIMTMVEKKSVENIKGEDKEDIKYDKIEDKDGVIETLNLLSDLIRPEKIITEKFFPIKVSDEGDVSIELKQDLEQQYQDCHKTLTTYSINNISGMKHEIAHLFYLNNIIESKIKKMKKKNPNYKSMVDLRARIINDFRKYLKIITLEEPDFNFGKYFKESEFYNGAITIDHGLMKLSGKLISKFMRGL